MESGLVKSAPESYYKNQIEKLSKENKQLKHKLDSLEKENKQLKKSLFQLSLKFDAISVSKGDYFNIDSSLQSSVLDEQSSSSSSPTDTPNSRNDSLRSSGSKTVDITTNSITSKSTSIENSPPLSGSGTLRRKAESKPFYCKYTLKGHTAPVHCISFSNEGRLLASGSFDKSVRIWDYESQQEISCLQGHTLNVSDVNWSNDNSELVSGGYDHSVKVWDTTKGKELSSFKISGFVQAVLFNPSDNNMLFVASTHKQMVLIDKRKDIHNHVIFENDSMVNTMYIHKDGHYVISGDAMGCMKTWDVRKPSSAVLSQSVDSDDRHTPISHIHVCKGLRPNSEGQYLAANCYDNILRVYDRTPSVQSVHRPMSLVHSLSGHKNKNWPIRSAFYVGSNYEVSRNMDLDLTFHDPAEEEEEQTKIERSIQNSFIIATGSADGNGYVYDIGDTKNSYLLQKLEGHKDKVFAVQFHPKEPTIASCSADHTIKLWHCNADNDGYFLHLNNNYY